MTPGPPLAPPHGANHPWPARIRRIHTGASAAVLLLLILLAPFDKPAIGRIYYLSLAASFLAVAWILLPGTGHRPHLPLRRFFLLAVTPVAIINLAGLARLWGMEDMQGAWLKLVAAGLQMVGLAAAVLGLAHARTPHLPPTARYWLGALAALFAWSYLTCFSSAAPDLSFLNFAEQGAGIHASAVGLLVILAARGIEPIRGIEAIALTGGAILLASAGIAGFAAIGGMETRLGFEERGLVRDVLGPGAFDFRLQWPFSHHNRLGSYALVVAVCALASAWGTASSRWRLAWLAAALAASLALALTQTRGTYLAVVAVIIALAVSSIDRRRTALASAVGIALIGVILAALPGVRDRAGSLLDPSTYTDPHSTVVTRSHAWRAAIEIGAARPLLGLGYGWKPFEAHYLTAFRDRFDDPDPLKPHAHNNALHCLAESGIPSLLLFIGLYVTALVLAWRARHGRYGGTLFALVIGLAAYGLTNHSMRYMLGGLAWMSVAIAVLLACANLTGPAKRTAP